MNFCVCDRASRALPAHRLQGLLGGSSGDFSRFEACFEGLQGRL